MDVTPCPICGSTKTLQGHCRSGGGHGSGFCPFPPQGFLLPPFVPFPSPIFHCLSCGHLWAHLDPDRVRSMIRREASEVEKQYLAILEGGPFHDVPDFPDAHAAAERVAEIDTLVTHGRQPEATRRLREIQGCTWDQPIAAMRGWRETTRARKLALFGWCPKPPPAKPGAETADHPLRDRELDG